MQYPTSIHPAGQAAGSAATQPISSIYFTLSPSSLSLPKKLKLFDLNLA
jgi:hypothetical protein